MANIIITKSNLSGIVSISDATSELLDTNFYLPSVYEGSEFSFRLNFDYFTTDEPPAAGNILSSNCITDLSNVGVTVTKLSANSYIVSGTYSNVIKGAIYTFVMRDGIQKNLPIDTSEDYRAIIRFRLPTLLQEILNVNFQLSLEDSGGSIEAVANTIQYVHYSYSSAVATFKTIVESRP